MRILTFILFLLLYLSCKQDTQEDFYVPVDFCNYLPSPCSLISIEQYIEISNTTPFPNPNSYTVNSSINNLEVALCKFEFEDELGDDYAVNAVLTCIKNIEQQEVFTDLSLASIYAADSSFISEDSFDHAIYFPDSDVYVIRKGNYIIELEYLKFTKEQQIEIANIMLSNLP